MNIFMTLMATVVSRSAGIVALAGLVAMSAGTPVAAQIEPLRMGVTEDDQPTIELRVADAHDLEFMISTGSNFTIVRPSTARLLDPNFAPESGSVVSFMEISDTSAGDLSLPVINAAVLTIDSEDENVAGLLALHDLGVQRLTIDFEDRQILPNTAPSAHQDGYRSSDLGLLLGRATITGLDHPINVVIDSGSNYTVANQVLKTQLQNRVRRTPIINDRELRGPRNDRRRFRDVPLRLRDVRVGGVCLNRVDASHVSSQLFQTLGWSGVPALIIGMDVLENAQLTVDFETGVFALDPANRRARCSDETRIQRPLTLRN